MKKLPLLDVLRGYGEYERLLEALVKGEGPGSAFGLGEAQRLHMAAALYAHSGKNLLYVCANESLSVRAEEAFTNLIGERAYQFPLRDTPLSGGAVAASGDMLGRRLQVLDRLCRGERSLISVSIGALMECLAPKKALSEASYACSVGDNWAPRELLKGLMESGYSRVELCEGRGQAALRGAYLDVFPADAEYPVRIEFFGDEIDTMRLYDPLSQRSIENVKSVRIPPAGEMLELVDGESSLLDYLPKDTLLFVDEPTRIEESGKLAYTSYTEALGALILSEGREAVGYRAKLMTSPLGLIARLGGPHTVLSFALTRSYNLIAPKVIFRFETRSITRYLGQDELLKEDLLSFKRQGYTVLLMAGVHAKRLQDRLGDMGLLLPAIENLARDILPGEQLILGESVPSGFQYTECKLAVVGQNELFGEKKAVKRAQKRPQLAFAELSVGDLVVHELYGIGRFAGIETLTVGAEKTTKDYLLLQYAGNDKLYIPTDQLDRVQKYIGSGDDDPGEPGTGGGIRLSKLGSGEWQKTVSRTRESVKKLAFDLAKLYGERNRQKGFQFSPDTAWQRRLEESFPYTETPDQLNCIAEIKRDMESSRVMDRLLCGDVGYGKTEVALRACFKAVMDSKQVAILVPTTILAQQHYNTLSARFSGFPVQVALLCRFNTQAETKRILEGLASGMIDVVVGTHKLLSKNVRFKDLGLLIVDEEQRFGVGHKEQIKNLKRNVDVLTLSATPIPRTLHMSMTGIRDMSVIETPPEQRYPVQTYVMEYSDAMAREAILKELGRGGQVYYVSNRVRGMELQAERLRSLVPEARIGYAHGQMGERQLEKAMLDFMEGQTDVLLCSTIVENGLDIPNVNTIIVTEADRMGLSQLYQLRGRVGRGSRLGYAYLTFRRDQVLNEVAEKRLSAIREFTQFGAGFKVAMRDLEIRGAGNLLGPEQSGHMAAVGYELYCKMVDMAVREARGEKPKKEIDTVMELPLSAYIPKNYIAREVDRLSMYKRIAAIASVEELLDVQDELIDRYGDIPEEVENLMKIAHCKAVAAKLWVNRVQLNEGEARLSFDPEAPMDIAKLYDHIKGMDAQLKGSESLVLILRQRGKSVKELCHTLPQFFFTLLDCFDEKA